MIQVEYRPLALEDRTQVVRLLSETYSKDPAALSLLQGLSPTVRGRWANTYFDLLFTTCVKYGAPQAAWIGNDLVGAALVYPPGTYPIPSWPQITMMIRFALKAQIAGLGIQRVLRLARVVSKLENLHPKSKHHYLEILVVLATHQEKGIGTEFLNHLKTLSDASGIGVFLETSNPRNLHLFERSGYKLRSQNTISEIRYWTFWRDPLKCDGTV